MTHCSYVSTIYYLLFLLSPVTVFSENEVSEFFIKEKQCIQKAKNLYCSILPKDIPDGITHVYLENVQDSKSFQNGTFSGKNWERVLFLQLSDTEGEQNGVEEIKPYGMQGLVNLEELHILSLSFRGLYYASFAGLINLKTLEFRGCRNLLLPNAIKAVSGTENLPKLEVFSIRYISWNNAIELGKDFFHAFASKPLKVLNIQHIDVNDIHFRYASPIIDTLQVLNFSEISIANYDITGLDSIRLIKNLKVIDVSHATLPKNTVSYVYLLPNIKDETFTVNLTNFAHISNVAILNLTGIYPYEKPLKLRNISFSMFDTDGSNWTTEAMVIRNNNLKYVDTTIHCNHSTIQTLDLSNNGMEYLRPNFCPCLRELQHINLSKNNFVKMVHESFFKFQEIFQGFSSLRTVDLSSNNMLTMPEGTFAERTQLEVINLSNNRLTQVHFRVKNLKRLTVLDIRNNIISVLDELSLANLGDLIEPSRNQGNVSVLIDLHQNPLSCATCETLQSITWLANVPSIYLGKVLTCTNHEGKNISIDKNAVKLVRDLCDEPIRIRNIVLTTTITPVSFVVSTAILISVLLSYRRKQKSEKKMKETVRLIRENALDTDYVVFVSYSSDDYGFLQEHVYKPLTQHLQDRTGTDRDLICMGDRNFQLGRQVADEIVRCLHESAVILILVSNEFCSSGFCHMEFDHAVRMNKPILLMMKDVVDESLMNPSMEEIFRNNTRLLWERHDGEMILKTSWDNVCSSILEMVPR